MIFHPERDIAEPRCGVQFVITAEFYSTFLSLADCLEDLLSTYTLTRYLRLNRRGNSDVLRIHPIASFIHQRPVKSDEHIRFLPGNRPPAMLDK